MLRHSLAHFDQIRILLGLILVNHEWRRFLKRKILHLQIWNYIWIPIWELCTWYWLRLKACSASALFLNFGFYQLRVKPIWKKWNHGFKNTKQFFDFHLRDASGFPSARNVEEFFFPFRSNSYRFMVDSGLPWIKVIFKSQNSSFANIRSYLDTHLRVVHVVPIMSEDV